MFNYVNAAQERGETTEYEYREGCHGWKYFIVLTDDDMKSVQQRFEALSQTVPGNQKEIEFGEKKSVK